MQHLQALGALLKWLPSLLSSRFLMVRLENSTAEGEFNLWDKIVKHAERMEAVTIEFACEDLATGVQLAALTWHSRTEPSIEFHESGVALRREASPPTWEFNYSVPRGVDIQARICAKGYSPEKTGAICLNQLSELLIALCQSWPVVDAPVQTADRSAA